MDDIDLELLRRNAWLKAWRDAGHSIEGRWTLGQYCELDLSCAACKLKLAARVNLQRGDTLAEAMNRREQGLYESAALRGCEHFEPLQREPPDEVRVLFALALLEGN
jgi:hypothetical protein